MRQISIAVALLVTGCSAAPEPVVVEPAKICMPAETFGNALGATFGEQPVVRGMTERGTMLYLFVSPGGRTYTILEVGPDGTACALVSGEGLMQRTAGGRSA